MAPRACAREHCGVRVGLGEAAWRFNRRFRLKALIPRLLVAVACCKPKPERALRAPAYSPCSRSALIRWRDDYHRWYRRGHIQSMDAAHFGSLVALEFLPRTLVHLRDCGSLMATSAWTCAAITPLARQFWHGGCRYPCRASASAMGSGRGVCLGTSSSRRPAVRAASFERCRVDCDTAHPRSGHLRSKTSPDYPDVAARDTRGS